MPRRYGRLECEAAVALQVNRNGDATDSVNTQKQRDDPSAKPDRVPCPSDLALNRKRQKVVRRSRPQRDRAGDGPPQNASALHRKDRPGTARHEWHGRIVTSGQSHSLMTSDGLPIGTAQDIYRTRGLAKSVAFRDAYTRGVVRSEGGYFYRKFNGLPREPNKRVLFKPRMCTWTRSSILLAAGPQSEMTSLASLRLACFSSPTGRTGSRIVPFHVEK